MRTLSIACALVLATTSVARAQVIVAPGDAALSLTVDGKTSRWKRGDVAFIGRNVKHESKNAGKPVDFALVAIGDYNRFASKVKHGPCDVPGARAHGP